MKKKTELSITKYFILRCLYGIVPLLVFVKLLSWLDEYNLEHLFQLCFVYICFRLFDLEYGSKKETENCER